MSRFQFSVPRRRGPDDGWFRVGTFDVGTTVLVVGLGVLSMLVYAVDKTLLNHLVLLPDGGSAITGVKQGGVWRLVTWPIVNVPSLNAVIILAIFWWFGRDLERVMGRIRFTWFLLVLTIVPATIATGLALAFSAFGGEFASGLRFVELGVFVAFIARYPTARFFFGIPGWVIAVVFVGIDFLQFVGDRLWFSVLLLLSSCATALLGLRAMGHAEEATWIPRLPIPGFAVETRRSGGGSAPKPKRRRGEGGNTVVSGPWSGSVPDFVDQEEIDRLLDKVAATGLASLTKEERSRLEAASRRKR